MLYTCSVSNRPRRSTLKRKRSHRPIEQALEPRWRGRKNIHPLLCKHASGGNEGSWIVGGGGFRRGGEDAGGWGREVKEPCKSSMGGGGRGRGWGTCKVTQVFTPAIKGAQNVPRWDVMCSRDKGRCLTSAWWRPCPPWCRTPPHSMRTYILWQTHTEFQALFPLTHLRRANTIVTYARA